MKRSKFTDSQIMDAIKRAEAGLSVPEICRDLGHQLGHLLQMAGPVWGHGHLHDGTHEGTGGREQPSQENVCRGTAQD